MAIPSAKAITIIYSTALSARLLISSWSDCPGNLTRIIHEDCEMVPK